VKAVVVGATKGMGRALARLMVERGDDLVLLGRDPASLAASARDLETRSSTGRRVHTVVCDLERPEGFAAALDEADAAVGLFNTVIITAAAFGTQEQLEADEQRLRRVLLVDFVNVILMCEQMRKRLLSRGGGTLCVFSSVAGDRGRSSNYLYGAAKAGLSRYLEGLDHASHRAGLRTVCVKPGFVRTSMTDGLPVPPFAGEADSVARSVLKALDRGTPVVYVPGVWRMVMLVVRLLPRSVMRRLRF
jgi:short-subunit dehydrogenase